MFGGHIMKKKLILVTSPPACGKTFVSRELAKHLQHVVYLDKDTLIPLSKQIFVVAGEPYNRSSDFFEEYIRNYEYDCVIELALEAIEYENIVLINAPFTREVRDINFMTGLSNRLAEKGAELVVVWVQTSIETVRERMIQRNSDRDTWKLTHWDEYIATRDFSIPENLVNSNVNKFYLFKNNNTEEFIESMAKIKIALEGNKE